jgi:hypothetical protein
VQDEQRINVVKNWFRGDTYDIAAAGAVRVDITGGNLEVVAAFSVLYLYRILTIEVTQASYTYRLNGALAPAPDILKLPDEFGNPRAGTPTFASNGNWIGQGYMFPGPNLAQRCQLAHQGATTAVQSASVTVMLTYVRQDGSQGTFQISAGIGGLNLTTP